MRVLRAVARRLLAILPAPLLAVVLPRTEGFDPADSPPRVLPRATAGCRVYIAPANSAGQGWQWSRALDAAGGDVSAVSMAILREHGFGFPVDVPVRLGTYRWSRAWQARQARDVRERFTHVIAESGIRLFGDGFAGSLSEELRGLRDAGVRVALLFHGSDIRLPSRHAASSPWSPFLPGIWQATPELQQIATRNAALIEALGIPVFVSTPDLLLDVPAATWVPVAIDVDGWDASRPALTAARPRVAHAPSSAPGKGSDVVDPVLRRLEAEGLVDYVRVEGVPSDRMKDLVAGADVVLDQFRAGSYGVAACEAMAAGRLVVGHVTAQVRDEVRRATGRDLPILEADPGSLERVLRHLVLDPGEGRALALAGPTFVREVHDGRRSVDALSSFLRS
jgi:hypothetical protein